MEEQVDNRLYLTGEQNEISSEESAAYLDIILDDQAHTLFLNKPLVIDLGAVANGFAIDLAANELNDFAVFVISAGGDLFAGGVDENGDPWKIGIQHPENKDQVISVLEVLNQAVCISGRQREQADIEREKEIARLIGTL